MFQPPEERKQKLIRHGRSRTVAIPEDFVLEGEAIIIRQEKDGVITIHPADETGRRAFCIFDLFDEGGRSWMANSGRRLKIGCGERR